MNKVLLSKVDRRTFLRGTAMAAGSALAVALLVLASVSVRVAAIVRLLFAVSVRASVTPLERRAKRNCIWRSAMVDIAFISSGL